MFQISVLRFLFTFFILFSTCSPPLESVYIDRFSAIAEHGAMTFTGNTLGLSKSVNSQDAGTSDAIGAYITTDNTQVPTYPVGTTLIWQDNKSAANLVIPPGSTILYAELVWSGSYGYFNDAAGIGEDPNNVLVPANGPVNFITPDNVVHSIISDPATRQNVQNNDPTITYSAGNYTRSQNVTAIVQAAGAGTYAAGHIPSTLSALDNTHNAAGWTLAVVYRNFTSPIQNMSVFVGCELAGNPGNPASVSGFCTPPQEPLMGRLLVSAIKGDATKEGGQMAFGPTNPPVSLLLGPNNDVNSFFASQINKDDGTLDTSGTFGMRNKVPLTNIVAGRQGYDITNVDCSSTLFPGQSQAFAQGITTPGAEDYTINALGIEVQVLAPTIVPVKKVNGVDSIQAHIGDIVTFTIAHQNTGNATTFNVNFVDLLEQGLEFVAGSFSVNNVPVVNPNLVTGVPLGDMNPGDIVNIAFQIQIVGPPASGNVFHNHSTVNFEFNPCKQEDTILNSVDSNIVEIVLPVLPPPKHFQGTVRKCKFLNRDEFSIIMHWRSPSEEVISFRIYLNGKIVAVIPANRPLVYKTCLHSKQEAGDFEITAVYPGNIESQPIKIRIVND